MEGVFWRKDGTSFPVEYINSPIWEQGKRMGAVVTFQDISERKQAEAALRQSEERFAKAFRASPVAFCVTRLEDGYFIDVNESFQRLYGYRRDELIGRKALDLNIYTNPTERAEIMRRVREHGSVRNYEMVAQAKSGELRRVLFSVEGMELEGEACIVATVIDITDRQRAEDEVRTLNAELEARVVERTAQLAVANQELAQANLAKDRFLASMSHELRTPLNAIIGFTGTLLMRLPGPLTADQEKQLRTIQTSARHLLSLINDLLDIAKIEAGQVELSRERIVCQEAIQEVAASLCPLAQAKGIGFDVLLPDDQIVLQADRRALNQILINLVNNAIKFTEHGSVQLGLHQRNENGRQLTEISVADTGIGIRLEDQTKLFRAFSQVDASDSRRHEGTGLGLHLSQKLAQLLGGQITVQSELGIGSTFTLALPAD
jgi:protein-histidine pros-kinase